MRPKLKRKLFETTPEQETAFLVAVDYKSAPKGQTEEYLDELEFLAETAGAKTLRKFTQKLDHPHSRTYVGEGKLEDIRLYAEEEKPSMVIFDDELSPSQIRNLEKTLNTKILDRSHLILDIFASRAQTAQAKTQVELAQMQYLLPRLTRMWTHLSKQQGGIGMKGPGETQIETDRRIILDKISLLKERLRDIDKQSVTRRSNRDDKIRVALVGYTNVGKSTIMNVLSKSEVLAENKLFATLDSTVRKVVLENIPFLLSDTVGFIRKLPHQLIECFKSTLDEVREADLLLHVVDISHPRFEEHIRVVKETLKDIKADDKPVIMIFNKIDLYELPDQDAGLFNEEIVLSEEESLAQLKKTWMARENSPVIFISAQKKNNIEELRDKITRTVESLYAFKAMENK
ncbi:MAG: GTPase HflX [Bacteroidetes bacterium]|nr:MAG: GTPase HflX [Bacteroidota bacterium]